MSAITRVSSGLALFLLFSSIHLSPAQSARFEATRAKLRIHGTSNLDDWQVETKAVTAFLEAGAGFPTRLGQKLTEGAALVRGVASIAVSSLHSIEKDGKPFSNKMDEIMYEKLKAQANPEISFRLHQLTLKSSPTVADSPYEFESKGDVVVAGVTNFISMAISVLPMSDGQFKLSGYIPLKMTDFKIQPPALTLALGAVKTGNEVKLDFELLLKRAAETPSSSR